MSRPSPSAPGVLVGHGPLSDVRVLDLSLLLPGPVCTQILADLGADVVKIEPPAGDYARQMPSELFAVTNRNKRSAVLDLKDPAHREMCLRLAEDADVLVEGFRPGVLDRLGVGYAAVRQRCPSIIYCSISGYGQTGPLRERPGHDATYLAASGALSFSGHWLEEPRRSGIPMADLAGATYAAIAILAALNDRRRTGNGAHLDVSLTDAAMAFTTVRGGRRLDLRPEDRLHLYPTNELFTTADERVIALGVVEDHFWQRLCEAIGGLEPRLLETRFQTEDGRRAHGDELKRILDELLRQRRAEEWIELLEAYDIPIQVALTLDEAACSLHTQTRRVVVEDGDDRYVVFPVLRDGDPMGTLRSPPPALGEHTSEVLRGRGWSEDGPDRGDDGAGH